MASHYPKACFKKILGVLMSLINKTYLENDIGDLIKAK